MWVMTHFGILMPSLRPVRGPTDKRELQIRARRRQDIDYLRRHYMPKLGETVTLGETDYQYRAYCTREEWADALRLIVLEIDYVKFKPTTEDKHNDRKLHDVYIRIWNVIFSGFPIGAYGNWQTKARDRKSWWEDADSSIELDEPSFQVVDDDVDESTLSIDDALEVQRAKKRRGKRGRK